MDSKTRRKTRLKKYLPHNGKWQFSRAAKISGKPNRTRHDRGKAVALYYRIFYLQWRQSDVRRTRPVGTTACEVLDAWEVQSCILAGDIEAPEEEPSTVDLNGPGNLVNAVVESDFNFCRRSYGIAKLFGQGFKFRPPLFRELDFRWKLEPGLFCRPAAASTMTVVFAKYKYVISGFLDPRSTSHDNPETDGCRLLTGFDQTTSCEAQSSRGSTEHTTGDPI